MKQVWMVALVGLLTLWSTNGQSAFAIDCSDHDEPTGCGWCCIWPWCDKCDWTETGTRNGVSYKNYTETDCTVVCAPSSGNSVTCNYGFTYAVGSQKWTWSSGLDIALSDYVTFRATYNSPVNTTTITYFCNGTETITSGNCGSNHFNSTKWNYVQKAYKQRVYDWHKFETADYLSDGLPYCDIVYDNPHICTPCVGFIATGDEVVGCDAAQRTVFDVPAKWTDACQTP